MSYEIIMIARIRRKMRRGMKRKMIRRIKGQT
jgi:uncharacterized membrane protein YdfJ with MMPL/SSD domain